VQKQIKIVAQGMMHLSNGEKVTVLWAFYQ